VKHFSYINPETFGTTIVEKCVLLASSPEVDTLHISSEILSTGFKDEVIYKDENLQYMSDMMVTMDRNQDYIVFGCILSPIESECTVAIIERGTGKMKMRERIKSSLKLSMDLKFSLVQYPSPLYVLINHQTKTAEVLELTKEGAVLRPSEYKEIIVGGINNQYKFCF